MIPIYQTIHGPRGNCYAACLASILEVELADVPDLGNHRAVDLGKWLLRYGWTAGFWIPAGLPLCDSNAPEGHAIASVQVLDHSIHAVVCRDGKIEHDPAGRPFARPGDDVVLWTVLEKQGCSILSSKLSSSR